MVNSQKLNSKNTILFEVIRHVTLYYVPITILLTIAQVSVEYFAIKSQIEKNINELITNFNDSLTNSLWTYNNEQTDTILSGIHKSTYVVGLNLKNEFDQIITTLGTTPQNVSGDSSLHRLSSILKVDELFEFKKKLYMTSKKDGAVHVGAINIYSGNSIIIEKLSRTIFYIIIGSLVKATFLWIILFYFFNKKIVLPTRSLLNQIKQVSPEHPKPFTQDISENITELYEIQKSFNQLIHQVKDYKDVLEAVVDNKTELIKEKDSELNLLFTKLSNAQSKMVENEKDLLKKLTVTQLFNELKPQLETSYEVLSRLDKSCMNTPQIEACGIVSSCLNSIDMIVNSSILSTQNDDYPVDTDLELFFQKTLSDWQTIFLNNHSIEKYLKIAFDCDPEITGNLYLSDMERLFFNILNTSLSSVKKRIKTAPQDYEPQISIAIKNYGESDILISVYDNGTGFNTKESLELEGLSENKINADNPEQVNLYLSHEISQKYKGKLTVNSEFNSYCEVQAIISKTAVVG